MKKLLAVVLWLLPASAFGQGYINPPIHADGKIYVPAGTTIVTNALNNRNPPANLGIYANGAISNWTVNLPSPAFDGQIVSIGCPGGDVATLTVAAADGIVGPSITSCTASAGQETVYQFNLSTWVVVSYPGQVPFSRFPTIANNTFLGNLSGSTAVPSANPLGSGVGAMLAIAPNANNGPMKFPNVTSVDGVDFSGVTFSGCAFKSPGFCVDPAGKVPSDNITFNAGGTGAVTKTVKEIMDREPIMPEMYGAVGDGVTDDRLALQRTCDAASSLGRPIKIPRKTYRTTDTITCDSSNLVIVGSPRNSTILLDNVDASKSGIVFGNGSTRRFTVEVHDLVVTRAQNGASSSAIVFNNVSNWRAINVAVGSWAGGTFAYGVEVIKGLYGTIDNSFLTSLSNSCIRVIGEPGALGNMVQLRVFNNECEHSPVGLRIGDYVFGFYVRNNVFFDNATAGVVIEPSQRVYGAYSPVVTAGGSGYVVGESITLTNATPGITQTAPAKVRVKTVSGGVITAVDLEDWGGFVGATLPSGTWTQAATTGAGTGATFTMGVVSNASSGKIDANDLDTTGIGVYAQHFDGLTLNANWYSAYSSSAITLRGTSNASISGGQFYGLSGANGIVLGDGTEANAAVGAAISGVVMGGGTNGIYIRGYSKDIAIGSSKISGMTFAGIQALEANISSLQIGRDSMSMFGNLNDYVLRAPSVTGFGSGAVTSGSTDTMGTVNEGANTNTGGTINFAFVNQRAPICQVTSPNGSAITGVSATATGLTITHPSTQSQQYTWRCMW